jgi:CRP-like cAMP-binding protein
MKIKTFKKQLSIKDIRLKSYKIMKKLNTIEDEEPINLENIDEMKSKSLLLKLLKSIKNSGNDFIEKDEDLLKAANLLYKIPSLQKFYKEYSITVKSLKEMLSFIEIKYLYKGNCLFNQDEIPNEMFVLLEGQLSLKYYNNIKQESTLEAYVINEFNLDYFHYRNFNNLCDNMDKIIKRKTFRKPISKNINFNIENDNFLNDSNFQNEEEIEYLIINDERFISQNNLLTLSPHSINCYVSSNECLVLVLDKKSFNISIQKNFMRYDLEYKKFICSRMNVFEKFHNETLNIYFYSWIKIYPKTHEKIFSFNDEAKYFYLLYNGECINIISNRNINIFSKGSFIGLDSLFNPNKKYTSTVICKNDNTMLFRFDPLTFNEKILNDLKLELNQFYEIKIQTSNDFILKKENMENKFKHNYIHLTKNYIQDKLKKNEDRIDLIENNPFNMNILSEEKERDKEKTSLNNKRHNKLFISLNKLKNSLVIKKNKTQQNTEINLIKYTNFSINKNIPKIKLKKKNVLNIKS